MLLDDSASFDNVQVIGVDEHVWRQTRRGDTFVTVVIDLTPVRDRTGPSPLLAMVEGRSQQAFQAWLAGRPRAWPDGLEVVAMDGFTGFKTATSHELPEATAVLDPGGHLAALAEQTMTIPSTEQYGRVIAGVATQLAGVLDQRAAGLDALLEQHPLAEVLTSMPGVGTRTAVALLLTLGETAAPSPPPGTTTVEASTVVRGPAGCVRAPATRG